MRFEWDAGKARSNRAKHKLSFETAALVFDNPDAVSVPERVVEGEERWRTVAFVSGVLLVVAHTYREEDGEEVIRIISARRATRSERQAYEERDKT